MNKERILAVASAIENRSIKGLGFNMARFMTLDDMDDLGAYVDHTGQSCETTACIAGWAYCLMSGGVVTDKPSYISLYASNWLELETDQMVNLFYASGRTVDCMAEITDVQAIKVLRHFAAAEEIDWKLA